MAPSSGFEEGIAAVQSTVVTGQISGGITCPIGHPGAANEVATGRTGHGQPQDVSAACMHAAQGQLSGRESSSEAADLDPACRRLDDEEEAFVGALDAPHSVKWCTQLCTTTSTFEIVTTTPTRLETKMSKLIWDVMSTCKRHVNQETLVPSLLSLRLSQQDSIDVHNLYSILRNQKF